VVPTIVFHGENDTTVNARNGEAVVAQALPDPGLQRRIEDGQAPGGHAFRRTEYVDAKGEVVIEQWLVRGAGHAWFGGSSAGSYTDPKGPDATREMMRFFLEHRRSP
jgi:poly(3-hydroxybutyrate) depolymerase